MSETQLANRDSKPFEVSELKEIAEMYGIPQSIVNLYWIKLGGTAYPKAPFKMMMAQKKGIQRIETKLRKVEDGYEVDVSIFPRVTGDQLSYLRTLSGEERQATWKYFTEPTVGTGRANTKNVKMGTMHVFLQEMAETRGLSRTCGKFAGLNQTGYEELPEAQLSQEQIDDSSERLKAARVIPKKDPVDGPTETPVEEVSQTKLEIPA